jgi:hypothetical protein
MGQMMTDPIKELLSKRRDRAIAIILSVKEKECDEYLSPEASASLRKAVLDQLNDYTALCVDLLNSYTSDAVILNEDYLAKIDDIHEMMTR